MKIHLTIAATVTCAYEGCTATQTVTIIRVSDTQQTLAMPYLAPIPFPGEQYLRDFLHDADAWSFNAQGASFCSVHPAV